MRNTFQNTEPVNAGDIVRHYDSATDTLITEPFPFKNAANPYHLDWLNFEVVRAE